MAWFEGKKTYICAVLMAAGAFAQSMNWITVPQFQAWSALVAALGMAALKSGQKAETEKVVEKVTSAMAKADAQECK